MLKSYRELHVWQYAIRLSLVLYQLTAEFPREEIYGLTAQLRRAGVSAASNIAEGYGRGSKADYRNFLCIARGSVLEVQTLLVIARELGYGDSKNLDGAEELADTVSKMLWSIIQKLGTSGRPLRSPAAD